MPYYSRIILNSFYNRLFPKLFRHNRRMPSPLGQITQIYQVCIRSSTEVSYIVSELAMYFLVLTSCLMKYKCQEI